MFLMMTFHRIIPIFTRQRPRNRNHNTNCRSFSLRILNHLHHVSSRERERVCQAVGNHGNYIKMSFFLLSLFDPSSLFMVNPLWRWRLSLSLWKPSQVKSGKVLLGFSSRGRWRYSSSKVLFIKTFFPWRSVNAPCRDRSLASRFYKLKESCEGKAPVRVGAGEKLKVCLFEKWSYLVLRVESWTNSF